MKGDRSLSDSQGMTGLPEVEITVLTDRGRKRNMNEDCYSIVERDNLVIISDGAGGHSQGDFASRVVVETMEAAYLGLDEASLADLKLTKDLPPGLDEAARRLIVSIWLANFRLFKINESLGGERQNIKDKILAVVCAINFRPGIACIAHIGDSRAYLIRDHKMVRLTTDHVSLAPINVNGKSGLKEFLSRAVGVEEGVPIDLRLERYRKNDIFLLCSDGLYKMIREKDILACLDQAGEDLGAAAKDMVDRANGNGGVDNITMSLSRVKSEAEGNADLPTSSMTVEAHKSQKSFMGALKKIYA